MRWGMLVIPALGRWRLADPSLDWPASQHCLSTELSEVWTVRAHTYTQARTSKQIYIYIYMNAHRHKV